NLCIHTVDLIDHALAIGEVVTQKLHSIPQVVVSPVLPVLNYSVKRHSQFTVFLNNTNCFKLALVPFLALKKTITPQWKHGNLTCKVSHFCNNAIGIATDHKVIVYALSYF